MLETDLPPGWSLEAHHVVPFADGGSEDRENIQIVCTSCHQLIRWLRNRTHKPELLV
jgi:hypothetical protein